MCIMVTMKTEVGRTSGDTPVGRISEVVEVEEEFVELTALHFLPLPRSCSRLPGNHGDALRPSWMEATPENDASVHSDGVRARRAEVTCQYRSLLCLLIVCCLHWLIVTQEIRALQCSED